MAYTLPPKAQALTPYDPSEGNYRVRLDANESFLLPTPDDRERMAQAAAAVALNRYPDHRAAALCEAFAAQYDLSPALVTAGNGSDELISVIFAAFVQKGDTVMTLAPDFSMYRFYATLAEADTVVLDKGPELTIDVQRVIDTMRARQVRVLLFSNPCNPTSLGLDRAVVRQIVTATDALVVLDEAYMDFWDQSLLDEVTEYDNLIILRTCSKALGLAGLRVGFAVANERLTGVLRAAKSPYNVNAVSQAMATVILQNSLYRHSYLPLLCASRDMLLDGLRQLETAHAGVKVWDSCTNFVLLQVSGATELYEELADRGILVRCLEGRYLRITAGTQAENREVIDTLAFLLKGREL